MDTQRIRSRLAAPRRVCGVGVRRARQVLFSADAGPKGSLVDRGRRCSRSVASIARYSTTSYLAQLFLPFDSLS